MIPSKDIAVYFGVPANVNNHTNLIDAINVFNNYDIVIFGKENLSNSQNSNYLTTKNIINQTSANIFGYIDGTKKLGHFKNFVNLWINMGVTGIFIDKFGYDEGNTRKDQRLRINHVHSKNLLVIATCTDPDDLFAFNPFDPPGLSEMGNNDFYLAMGYQVNNGEYRGVNDWLNISNKMKMYREMGPGYSKMLTLGTIGDNFYDQQQFDYVYYSTNLYGFDGCGWAETDYSENTNFLPFRPRKKIVGNKLLGHILNDNNQLFFRTTNGGISINTITHEISNIFMSTH